DVSGKCRAEVNINEACWLFIMGGWGTKSHLEDVSFVSYAGGRGFYKPWGGSWAVWGGGTYKFNEKMSFNAQVSADQWKNVGVAANVAYDIVPGFTITAEVDYSHAGRFGDANPDRRNYLWTGGDKKNAVGGVLRFQRSF
ncbi:porin, partial [Mesorhizobium sp. M00.F.Ca.ET.149.01.1.1]